MGFAVDITAEERALGFEPVAHGVHGVLVTAPIGIGIRAVKVIEGDAVTYAICDDRFFGLYASASSLRDLRERFGLGARRAG